MVEDEIRNRWAKCENLAQQKSILTALEDELRRRGFAGPADVPKLVYLSTVTRFFDKPVSLVIKGPSGSGKSYALRAGLQFVPNSAFEEFSGMSEKALVYHEGLDLKHRYLVIGEAAGLAQGDGRAFLRQLLSEGKVRYVTVQSTPKGMVGKELKPVEGPTGLIMTTTANALHPEDESRMLSYNLSESLDRVRDALVKQALGQNAKAPPLDTEPWYALHEWVGSQNLSVEIPFAVLLARELPLSHFRVLRDFPQIVSLIKAHALLHQFNRKRNANGEVIATLEDYRAVYDLTADMLAQGLEKAVSDQIREVVEAVHKRGLEGECSGGFGVEGVSQVELAEKLGRDQSVVSRNARKAVGMGYLKDLTPGQGRKATLVMGDRELPSGAALPDPETLKAKLELIDE